MNKYILQARNEGLNWQTLLIEDAETRIKIAIKDSVVKGRSFNETNRAIVAIVRDVVKDIAIPELRNRSRALLLEYATREYWRILDELKGYDLKLMPIMMLIVAGKAVSASQARELRRAADISSAMQIRSITPENAVKRSVTGYYEIGQPLKEYSKNYMTRVERTFNTLAESTTRDGYASNVSLRNIAEMTVRYERHLEELDELKKRGVRLVWISTHANCSKRCEPWQGKLYSLDGSSGTIDGIRFRPLEDATDIYYTTKAGKTYKNGIISGFNCRHRLIPYEKGTRPVEVPAKVVEKQREINDTQRALERYVRKYRDLAAVYKDVDADKYKEYRKAAITANDRYITYSKENKVAYYPSRTAIFENKRR